jgi:type III pantothenate kinase
MIVAADIGNSAINIGYFTGPHLLVQNIRTWPLLSAPAYLASMNRFINENNIEKIPEGIIISSVVPDHTDIIGEALSEMAGREPLFLGHTTKTGIHLAIPRPDTLGPDRIANSVAAYEFYRSPVASVDCGTATTISVVGKDADYIGGAIMPGIRLMNESLAKSASQLSEVPVLLPDSALGKDTAECIQSGILYGTAGAVERILEEIESEAGFQLRISVTGGYGKYISPYLKRKHAVMPHLTLEGLRIIYLRNQDA